MAEEKLVSTEEEEKKLVVEVVLPSKHRRRVVNVNLSANPSRILSVSIPESENWREFEAKVLDCFQVDCSVRAESLVLIELWDAVNDRWVFTHNNNTSDDHNNNMESIPHKSRLRVHLMSEEKAIESVSDESMKMMRTLQRRKSIEEGSSLVSSENAHCLDWIPIDMFGRLHRAKQTSVKDKRRYKAPKMAQPMHRYKFDFDAKGAYKRLKKSTSVLTLVDSSAETKYIQSDEYALKMMSDMIPQSILDALMSDDDTKVKMTFNQLKMEEWMHSVMICHGGKFALGIFKGGELIKHKTFARYVTRAKQGRRQASYMAHSGRTPGVSGGATKRAVSEVKLRREIRQVISAWHRQLMDSHTLFIHAPGPVNEFILYGSADEQRYLYPTNKRNKNQLDQELSAQRIRQCIIQQSVSESHWKSSQNETKFRLYRKDPRIKPITHFVPRSVNLDAVHSVYRFLTTMHLSFFHTS